MIKQQIALAFLLVHFASGAQTLSELRFKDERVNENLLFISLVSKRRSNCLFDDNKVCLYGTNSPGFIAFSSTNPRYCCILWRNHAGYCPGVECDYDSLEFTLTSRNEALVVRTQFDSLQGGLQNLSVVWKKHSLTLTIIDTIIYTDKTKIKRVFRKAPPDRIEILVLQSNDIPSVKYFFSPKIGLIKLVNPDKWDDSFYLIDKRTKKTLALTSDLNKFIQLYYPDPEWLELFPTKSK